ncbi:PREDICTED: uncharacterized protein LOC109587785 [Amphimedon queenslandica]|uniref:Uncharacterized protein n=1 Tax=Amphimedon queenslandica TaxID=400682 RepID=A0AAN0JRT1_AMPQE|nr:PREDICTED: uncharacterized protein LOC109587785 [Amphimedon queenslandica]|eukprot:XP_019859563.1 PREDICTED: uncharacterized protein LOC109587785 [Amphimedon queenslandica]
MSIEEIRGEEGGQEDLKKLLKQYERELQEAKEELKQRDEEIRLKNEEIISLKSHERNRLKDEDGDEVKAKDECGIDNRKDLEERDAFIRHLNACPEIAMELAVILI